MDLVSEKLTEANEKSWMACGVMWESMGDYDSAIVCFESALRYRPNNVKILTMIGLALREKGMYSKAIEIFNKVLKINPKSGEVWGYLGYCNLMLEDLHEAYKAYQEALHYLPQPTDPKLWYGIGVLYDRYGSNEHSIQAYTAVLKMDSNFPKNYEIYYRLGAIHKQEKDYLKALEYFEQALKYPLTDKKDTYLLMAECYKLLEDEEKAIEYYTAVLKIEESNSKALKEMAILLSNKIDDENKNKAVLISRALVEAYPNVASSYYTLGTCLASAEQLEEAAESFQKSLKIEQNDAQSWYSLGLLYQTREQHEEALITFSNAAKLKRDMELAWAGIGSVYESVNQISDAISAYKKASDLNPEYTKKIAELEEQESSTEEPSLKNFPEIMGHPFTTTESLPPLVSGV